MFNSNYNAPGNNFTFHLMNIPPPPQPPRFFIPSNPVLCQELKDKEFIQTFECKIRQFQKQRHKCKVPISKVFEQLKIIISDIEELRNKNDNLRERISSISDDEWNTNLGEIQKNKFKINKMLKQLNSLNLKELKPLLVKRTAKRLRLKRVRMEKKAENELKFKEQKERSRKIDENLQKIRNEVLKAKQEEETKVQADIVLKEVLRKKNDAKKCITKLDAIVRLRRARQNTVKGRGESVTEKEANSFNNNIEKLKSLWRQKLTIYDKEESELREKLKHDSNDTSIVEKEVENQMMRNLGEWRMTLFGGLDPQVDFGGDISRFIAVRSKWDRFISNDGTRIPVGWIPPKGNNVDNSIVNTG